MSPQTNNMNNIPSNNIGFFSDICDGNEYPYRQELSLEEIIRKTFDLLGEGIIFFNESGVIQYINRACGQIFKTENSDVLLGKNIKDFISAEFLIEYESLIKLATMSNKSIGPIEVDLSTLKGEKIPLQLTFSTNQTNRGKIICVNVRDISSWKFAQNELINTHLELELSYWATLQGWVKALELRDHETEEHTHRVTETTVKLALAYGIGLNRIPDIRCGALLHDIGKLAVPDSILLKPGPLTAEEWGIMKLHPVYAYDLLKPIQYLRQALDIPYCHHEKWDGSGYPQGLKGKEIPLAARIFSIVDVWDALLSDRPYRPGWTKDDALAYIRENSGTHFDPKIVDLFFKII